MSVSLDIQKQQDSTSTNQYDVVVMGAGPYGLSVSAHLLGQGLKVATFGKPNYFWRNHMPQGMLLRSYWWATSLSDPQGKYSFAKYFAEKGQQPFDPLPRETFLDYVEWFQKNAVPNVDETYIVNIERKDQHFAVTLEDGRVLQSKAVIVAPGLHFYLYSPAEYAHMPSSLVSHSADHNDLSKFAGKSVAVIGGGQGALESAALLHESGSDVQVLMRKSLHWLPVSNLNVPAFIRTLRAPQAGMGNGWRNWLQEKFPYATHDLPRKYIDDMVDHTHGPAGSHWLRPRIEGQFTVKEHVEMRSIEAVNDKAKLTLSNGEVIEVDHVLLGTGYRPDVQRLTMIEETLRNCLRTHHGSPLLNTSFETNVPGMYFVGFTSARSFGPFYRFVVGADAAARRVSAAVARQVHAR